MKKTDQTIPLKEHQKDSIFLALHVGRAEIPDHGEVQISLAGAQLHFTIGGRVFFIDPQDVLAAIDAHLTDEKTDKPPTGDYTDDAGGAFYFAYDAAKARGMKEGAANDAGAAAQAKYLAWKAAISGDVVANKEG